MPDQNVKRALRELALKGDNKITAGDISKRQEQTSASISESFNLTTLLNLILGGNKSRPKTAHEAIEELKKEAENDPFLKGIAQQAEKVQNMMDRKLEIDAVIKGTTKDSLFSTTNRDQDNNWTHPGGGAAGGGAKTSNNEETSNNTQNDNDGNITTGPGKGSKLDAIPIPQSEPDKLDAKPAPISQNIGPFNAAGIKGLPGSPSGPVAIHATIKPNESGSTYSKSPNIIAPNEIHTKPKEEIQAQTYIDTSYKAGMGASRSQLMNTAMDQLSKEGVPEQNKKWAAATLVGLTSMESLNPKTGRMNPTASHDQNTGYGIYGAGKERKDNMLQWLQKNGYEKDNALGQMRYMAHEAMTNKRFEYTRNQLMNADEKNVDNAYAIRKNFEAPRNAYDQDAPQKFKEAYAAKILQQQTIPKSDIKPSSENETPKNDAKPASTETYNKSGSNKDWGKERLNITGNAARYGTNPQLISAAKEASKHLPEGYRVEAYSGFRPGDKRPWHGKNIAVDFVIKDKEGKPVGKNAAKSPNKLGNYQYPENFRTYETFAQDTHAVLAKTNPNLAKEHRFGGYFGGNYGRNDLMHQDFGRKFGGGMQGTWEKGLNIQLRQGRNKSDTKEHPSEGMGKDISNYQYGRYPNATPPEQQETQRQGKIQDRLTTPSNKPQEPTKTEKPVQQQQPQQPELKSSDLHLQKGKTYSTDVNLGMVESVFAGKDRLKSEFEKHGFKDAEISGSGRHYTAKGKWDQDEQVITPNKLDSHLSNFKQQKENWEQLKEHSLDRIKKAAVDKETPKQGPTQQQEHKPEPKKEAPNAAEHSPHFTHRISDGGNMSNKKTWTSEHTSPSSASHSRVEHSFIKPRTGHDHSMATAGETNN
jgi:hypothetical protein